MEWEVSPQEYRYILGDFVRSGISIKYEKVSIINGVLSEKTIYFPYITGRQYHVYADWHCVSSERDSFDYCILGEIEAGELVDYDIEYFKEWKYFCEAFDVDAEDNSLLNNHSANVYYAFVYDYKMSLFPVPIYSYDDIQGGVIGKNIQKLHIFEMFENYKAQEYSGLKRLYYPIYMSLDWFYFVNGRKLSIETVIQSVSSNNRINQDDLMTNYVIDSFPYMSETEIIEAFKTIRDNYAGKNKTKRDEWYVHTAALMDGILKDDKVKCIERKVKVVRSFCNNQGVVLSELSENNIPYLKNVDDKYKKKVDVIYERLLDEGYICEETVLSDFKYYLTGELELSIKGKIYWKETVNELVDFIGCILKEKARRDWGAVIKIFICEGKELKRDSLKSIKYRSEGTYIEFFKELFK